MDLQSQMRHLEPISGTGSVVQPKEKGTSDRKSFIAVKHPTPVMEAALPCTHIHPDRPSLRALACTLALRFEALSLSRSVWMGTSSTELCQIQLENFARDAITESHSCEELLQRPKSIVHGDASARACSLPAHVLCLMASMQLVMCCYVYR